MHLPGRAPCVRIALTLLLIAAPTAAFAKKPLDHDAYDRWSSLSRQTLSNDGKWILLTVTPAKGDAVTCVVDLASGRQYTLPRSRSATFSFDSRFVACLTSPKKDDDTKPAKTSAAAKTSAKSTPAKKMTAKKETPKTSLVVMELASGRKTTIADVKSFTLPTKSAGWIAYLAEPASKTEVDSPGQSTVREVETIAGKSKRPATTAKRPKQPATKKKSATSQSAVGTLAVRNLSTGVELRFPFVARYQFSENGQRLAFSVRADANSRSGVFVLNTKDFATTQVAVGRKVYRNLTFDKPGKQLAFFAATSGSPKAEKRLYHWKGGKSAAAVASPGKRGFARDRRIAANSRCTFSEDGSRLFFATVKRPATKPKSKGKKKTTPVKVDIWHWKDPYLQPMQLVRASREKNRNYLAVVHLKTGRTVQLADESLPSVILDSQRNADVAVGTSDLPYRMLISWDWPRYTDYYLVHVNSGRRQRILRKAQLVGGGLSPSGKYLTWFDVRKQTWRCYDIPARKQRNLTQGFPYPLFDETHDRPYPASPYGAAGWLKDESAYLVYDKHDLWSLDPAGKRSPVCVTEEFGRKHNLRFRRLKLDPEERGIEPGSALLLSAFHLKSKSSGFYRDRLGKQTKPVKVVMKDESIRLVAKARKANTVVLTRSTFRRFPDLWQSTTDFKTLRRITDVNRQQKDYNWGRAELVQWKSKDGQGLQGILIKPENFNPKKKYPMLVYFYERMSNRLHRYYTPAPVRASINPSFYASRGYLVFIPDINYKIGAPGESAVNCIIPGVRHVVAKGFVDERAIGVQGHSWGGYQVAYLVTRTNIFAAAESGAPVSNMTSAYGGIRWSTGMSRMFQYERTQSRIGATLWQAREKYLENSPLFNADRVNTPLLILHNDKDGAVPWYQGIELFVALRRLSKPAWLINYNGEGHGISKAPNRRDFSIRMQQFFDHFLKGAPAPVWLAKGVPGIEKGKTTGLKLLPRRSNKRQPVAAPRGTRSGNTAGR